MNEKIIAVTTHPDGSNNKRCIDGKQRLTAILRFMEGLIPYMPAESHESWYYKDSTATRKVFPPAHALKFANTQLVCVEYSDLDPADECDVFSRVQKGVPLTPAEKLGASCTPRSNWIKELCCGEVIQKLPIRKERGCDFRVVGGIVYNIAHWPRATDASAFAKWVQEAEPVPAALQKDVEDTLNVMSRIPFNLNGRRLKRISPLEMIGQGILIHAKRQQRGTDKSELQTDSEALHKEIQEEFHDLRLNKRCGTWVLSWVKARLRPGSLKRAKEEEDDEGGMHSSKRLTVRKE